MKKKITTMKLGEGLGEDRTDWERLRAMTDEEIDCSDIPAVPDGFFKDAKVVLPPGKEQITLRVDSDVLHWMKEQGKGYQTKMNAVLRAYYEAHKDSDETRV